MSRKAYAKINLTFEVLGRRRDGYHEIVTVMQAIGLCDSLTFAPHDSIHLASDTAELVSPQNLIYRAARLLQELAQGNPGAAIALGKGIPLASGLGGGSSDAAATLRFLNEMWGVSLPRKRLVELAAQLGSDVPFFVSGSPTALATGRGEKVARLPSPAKTWVVLVRPAMEMPNKTKEMYSHLDPSSFTKGQHARGLVDLVGRGERITNSLCFNVFDSVAPSLFTGLDSYRHEFLAAGADEVHLAGSGPTLFTLGGNKGEGEEILRRMKKQRMEAYLVETL
jgi:4-diphosphocytidyl-2-C-methyl-D-erythritol kinase